jgi:MFS family permease
MSKKQYTYRNTTFSCYRGYITQAIISPYPLLSLLACSLCGLSVSLMWPGTFSLTSAAFPRGGTLMFGILAICGDLGCSFGPWMAGRISDYVKQTGQTLSIWMNAALDYEQMGLRSGLLAASIFPVLMALSLLIFRRRKSVRSEE